MVLKQNRMHRQIKARFRTRYKIINSKYKNKRKSFNYDCGGCGEQFKGGQHNAAYQWLIAKQNNKIAK